MKRDYFLYFLLFLHLSYGAQVPSYYQGIDFTLSGDSLKDQLSTLIITTHHTRLEYTSNTSQDTWDVIKSSDTYLQDTTKVFLVYGYDDNDLSFENDLSRDKGLSCHGSPCDGLWNREHVYAKSLATPSLNHNHPGSGTDVHNLRSCDYVTNTWRGNLKFGDGNGVSNQTTSGFWFPGEEWKGDIARIIMYMYLRYPNQCSANDVGSGTSNYSLLGDMPDIFLEWNSQDSVSAFEEQRNNVIAQAQGNRNPFIDNPYLATAIWDGPAAENPWGPLGITNYEKDFIKAYFQSDQNSIVISGKNAHQVISVTMYSLTGQQLDNWTGLKKDVSDFSNGVVVLVIKTQTKLMRQKIRLF